MSADTGKTKVAVIGCGTVAWIGHLPWYWEHPDVEIAAVCSGRRETAEKAAARWQVKDIYTDYKKLLERDDIDAVSICTPVWFHKEMIIEAAKRGKHILAEKPFARDIAEAREIVDAVKQSKVIFMSAFMKRFNAGFKRIKALMDEGRIGRPYHLNIHWNVFFPPGSRPAVLFCEDKRVGGGVFLDIGCHYIDLCRWLFGSEIKSAIAEVSKVVATRPFEDHALVTFRFENGATATMDMGFNVVDNVEKSDWDHHPAHSMQLVESGHIYGSEGTVCFDSPTWDSTEMLDAKIYTLKGRNCDLGGWHNLEIPVVRQPGGPNSPLPLTTSVFQQEIRHFIECVRTNKTPQTGVMDGFATTAAIDAAYKAAETGNRQPVAKI